MKGRMDDVEETDGGGETNQPLTMGPQKGIFFGSRSHLLAIPLMSKSTNQVR